MTCYLTATTEETVKRQETALDKLRAALKAGSVTLKVDRATGAVAFVNWRAEDREGLADVCTVRKLLASNSPEMRLALMKAEALAGRKMNASALAAGIHSHDGGQTFGPGHSHGGHSHGSGGHSH